MPFARTSSSTRRSAPERWTRSSVSTFMPELAGMVRAEDVSAAVVFALERPRTQRILELAFRPMSESSWG